LDAANVSHVIHYPVPVHLQPAFVDLGYKSGSFPVTEALVPKIISLPMFPELTDSQMEQVAGAVPQGLKESGLYRNTGSLTWAMPATGNRCDREAFLSLNRLAQAPAPCLVASNQSETRGFLLS
jgi:DegT/DnrJ/EryC1/StrS aminotransferase family